MSAHRLLAAAPDDISADIIGVLEELAALCPHTQWGPRHVHAALVLAAEARVLLARLAGDDDGAAVAALGVELAVVERHGELNELWLGPASDARDRLDSEIARVSATYGGGRNEALWHIAAETVAMEREAGS